jgi:hypothetical protein
MSALAVPPAAPSLPCLQLGEEIVVGNNIGESVVNPDTELMLEPQAAAHAAEGSVASSSHHSHHSQVGTTMQRHSERLRLSGSGAGAGSGTGGGPMSAQAGSGALSGGTPGEWQGSAHTPRLGGSGAAGATAPLERLLSHAFLGRTITRKTLLFRGLRLKVRWWERAQQRGVLPGIGLTGQGRRLARVPCALSQPAGCMGCQGVGCYGCLDA